MKLDVADRIVATSHDFPTVNCTIDPEDMRYISSLLRNNYSNTILATIRETYANAIDANKDNGLSPESIEIKSPNSLDQTYSVRDFGPGLSRDQIFNLYSKFGKSTKRGSDLSIGGFGIGRFAPLSYKDSFTVTSYYNGVKSIYSIYISEENDTKIDEIFSEQTSEHNGVCISVAVAAADTAKFNNEISSFFSYFDVLPNFLNLHSPIIKREVMIGGKNWKIFENDRKMNNWTTGTHGIVMGGIYYPIDIDLVDFDNSGSRSSWISSVNCLVIFAEIGSVSLHHSRESLEYNKVTKNFLKNCYADISDEIVESVKKKVVQFDCLRDVMLYFQQIDSKFCSSATDLFDHRDCFVFKGYKVKSVNFNKSHYTDFKGNTTRIPVSVKLYNMGASKVVVSRCWNVFNTKKSCIVFNDCPENTKVVPRIYNLFKNNGYESVIVISHDSAVCSQNALDGIQKFKEENRFDLVKNHVYNLSSLVPVKLPSNRKKTSSFSGGSNNFYEISDYRNRFVSLEDKTKINDTSFVKVYFTVSDGRPVEHYSSLAALGKFETKTPIFKNAISSLGVDIYGISNNIVKSNKFKKRTDFIDFIKYVQDKWNSLNDAQKACIFDYFRSTSDDECLVISNEYLMENIEEQKIFQKNYDKTVGDLNLFSCFQFADFIWKNFDCLNDLGIKFEYKDSNLQSVRSETFNNNRFSIFKKYPMLEIYDLLYDGDRRANLSTFKDYVAYVNSHNLVDNSAV